MFLLVLTASPGLRYLLSASNLTFSCFSSGGNKVPSVVCSLHLPVHFLKILLMKGLSGFNSVAATPPGFLSFVFYSFPFDKSMCARKAIIFMVQMLLLSPCSRRKAL